MISGLQKHEKKRLPRPLCSLALDDKHPAKILFAESITVAG
jgi:hypothetical protein